MSSNENMTNHTANLHARLWDIANTLRGKMGADEFRDYILGFIFYKYLSEKCYSKCMAIRKSIKNSPANKTGYEPALPNGYKTRNGGTGSSRPTGEDLMTMFMGA